MHITPYSEKKSRSIKVILLILKVKLDIIGKNNITIFLSLKNYINDNNFFYLK